MFASNRNSFRTKDLWLGRIKVRAYVARVSRASAPAPAPQPRVTRSHVPPAFSRAFYQVRNTSWGAFIREVDKSSWMGVYKRERSVRRERERGGRWGVKRVMEEENLAVWV